MEKSSEYELGIKLFQYAQKFDDEFPMIPLGWSRSDEEVIKIINRCIKEEKNVYELGYLKLENGVKY